MGSWNDLASSSTGISGYVVEFGGKNNNDATLGTGFTGVTTASSTLVVANAASAPSAPVVTSTNGDSSATLSWTPPIDGGAVITGYQVSTNGGVSWTTITPTTTTTVVNGNIVTTLSTTLTSLTNGSGYNAVVRAVNSAGNGATSNSVALSPRGVPDAPTSVSATRGNAQVTVGFTVPANMNGATATSYLVTASPGGATATCTSSPCTVTGLTNGTAYTFTVQAINVAGTGPASAPSSPVTPATVPGAPTINTVTPANSAAVITFSQPASDGGSAIAGYAVTSGGSLVAICTVSPCTISGLTNGVSYSFTMHATNAIGNGPESAASSAVTLPTAPSAPLIGTATRGNGQASVAFTPPASGGSPITGYTVTSAPGGITATCTTTPCVITGLTNGTAYTFTVKATNAVGSGASSAASNSVTPATTPGAPTITAVSSAANSATVTFTPPASDGGSAITGYTLTSAPGGVQVACSASPCTISGLTNGAAYTFTVHATNALGNGPESSASASATPATVPGAPTIGTATGGNGQASVSFTAPASNGGAMITSYTVTSVPGGITATCTASPCVITGLTNGTAYTFTVKATNPAGSGASSVATNSVTPATAPGTPTITAISTTANAATLTFTPPASNGGSAITGYTVTASPDGAQVVCAASPCTISGLTNGQAYTFTVHASNAVGSSVESAASASVTPATTASAPTVGTAVGGNAQATVTFTASTDSGGSPITGYTIVSSPAGIAATCAASPCIVSGLTNGTAYTFTVRANNGVGAGAASAATNSVTPATTPGVPTSVSATAADGTASVSFATPASNGGSAITNYVVTVSPGGTTVDCAASPCAITGLANGTAYRFTVHAVNAVGAGIESALSTAVTPATTPDAPTAVSAARGDGSAIVTFTPPISDGGNTITGYVVTTSPGGATTTCASSPCTIPGLTNGTAYTFTVHAVNSVGSSVESSASTAITPATVPGAPAITNVSRGNGSASVSFTAPASDGGSALTGYVVTVHPGGATVACTSSPCTIPGLANGTAYTFTVHAANSVGAGAESASSAAITPATAPDAPGNLTVQRGNGSADLTFDPPTADGGNAITDYEVSTDGGLTWGPLPTTGTAPITASITGLTNGTAYDIEVRAVNNVGHGTATGPQGATPATVPNAPTNAGGLRGDSSIAISWTAPTDNGGDAITGYVVTTSGGQTCTTTTTQCTVTGLTNGTAYTYTVHALNAVGSSVESNQGTATPATVPDTPTAVTSTFGNGSATVSFTAPTGDGGLAVTAYLVTAGPGGATQACTSSPCTVTGLTNGTAYTFTVHATNLVGNSAESAPSNAVTPATVPGVPGSVTVVRGDQSAQITFVAPATNGSPITGYEASTDGGLTWHPVIATGSSPMTATVTGLTNGSAYDVQLKAVNAVGAGTGTASAAIVPAGVPGASTNVQAVAGDGQATVTFTAASSNGTTITGYTIVVSPGGASVQCTASPCVIPGLADGTTYTFTVSATNAAGNGLPSAPSNPVIAAGAPAATPMPQAAMSLNSALVSWVPSSTLNGAVVTGYTVVTSPGGGTCTAVPSATPTCVITGLTAGVAYTFTVITHSSAGDSAASVPSVPAMAPLPTNIESVKGDALASTGADSRLIFIALALLIGGGVFMAAAARRKRDVA